MKHLAAYLLLGLGGNTSPSAADVKAVLESVGIEADNERLEKLLSELEGKDINEVRLRAAPPFEPCLTPRSSSPPAPRSSPPSPLVALVVPLLPAVLLPVVPPLRRPPLPPLRRRRRSPMTTWASVFSTKRIANSVCQRSTIMPASHRATKVTQGDQAHLGGVERAVSGIMGALHGCLSVWAVRIH